MQKSFGSAPALKDFASLIGHLAVALIPLTGQIITVTLTAGSAIRERVSPAGDGVSGGSVLSCQVLESGVGDGLGRLLDGSSIGRSSGTGSSDLFGTVPIINSSTRRNSAGTLVTNISFGSGGGSAFGSSATATGGVSATVLSGGIKNSPVVQKRVLPAIYVGATYDFGGQKREVAEASSPTWFKLMYGQATEDGCHLAKIITARCLSTASKNATSIAGLQVGKTLAQGFNGWPVDVVAYAGLLQHNDRGLQPNGAQLIFEIVCEVLAHAVCSSLSSSVIWVFAQQQGMNAPRFDA